MFCEVIALSALSKARLVEIFSSSTLIEESLPILVDVSEVGVEDIAPWTCSELHTLTRLDCD